MSALVFNLHSSHISLAWPTHSEPFVLIAYDAAGGLARPAFAPFVSTLAGAATAAAIWERWG
eukprot:2407711-Amphidinium_carterae.1